MKEIEKYLGFTISLNETGSLYEQFIAKKGEIELTDSTLTGIKFKIKSTAWEEKKIIAFLGTGYSGELKKIKITKFNKKTFQFNYRIIDSSQFFDGSERYRTDVGKTDDADESDRTHIFPFTEKNQKVFDELKEQQRKIQAMEIKAEEIFSKLEGRGKFV